MTYQELDISFRRRQSTDGIYPLGDGTTDGSVTYCGWNIDDIEITSIAPVSHLSNIMTTLVPDNLFSRIDRVAAWMLCLQEHTMCRLCEFNVILRLMNTICIDNHTLCSADNLCWWLMHRMIPGPGDSDISDPLEDGTAVHPYDAIQEAIKVSLDGDTVLVKDGHLYGTW